MYEHTYSIGVDLGGTKIEAALIDSTGKIDQRLFFETRVADGSAAIVSDIVRGIKQLKKKSNGSVLGVGLGTAGQIEKMTGVVKFSPNLHWHNVALQADLSRSLELPVIVTNDVRAATYGEWLHGSGEGYEDLLCIFVGTGIGGGIVSGGHLLTGCSNAAGEIGHMTIDLHGPKCTCGNFGCFEALASGWAIGEQARKAVQKHSSEGKTILSLADGKLDKVSAKFVFQAARQDDELAKKIVEEAGEVLIAGVAGLVNAFNPKRVIMGGGVIQGWPEYVAKVKEGVAKRALKAAVEPLEIVESKLHGDAAVIGAAALALRSTFQDGGK